LRFHFQSHVMLFLRFIATILLKEVSNLIMVQTFPFIFAFVYDLFNNRLIEIKFFNMFVI